MTTNKQIEELIAQLDLHSNYDEAVVCPRCIPITAMEAAEALRSQQKRIEELERQLKSYALIEAEIDKKFKELKSIVTKTLAEFDINTTHKK